MAEVLEFGTPKHSPQPFGDVFKAPLVRYIIHEHDSHRAAIVRGRDRVKPLLARRVPYLQFDFLPVKLNGFYLEVDP